MLVVFHGMSETLREEGYFHVKISSLADIWETPGSHTAMITTSSVTEVNQFPFILGTSRDTAMKSSISSSKRSRTLALMALSIV